MPMGRPHDHLASFWAIVLQVSLLLLGTYCCSAARQLRSADDVFSQTLPVITPEPLLPFTHEKLELVALTARLSLSTYQSSFLSNLLYDIDEFDYEADGGILLQGGKDDSGLIPLDRVLLYEKDTYCFVTYMGTFLSIDEWTQNLNFTVASVSSRDDPTKTCLFRGGFVEAYDNAQPDEVASWIDQCMNNNLNNNPKPVDKQLVMTGHSQGGAIALIAALVHEQYNPLTITVGQPPSLTQPTCSGIDDDHVWRFINTEDDVGLVSKRINYDLVPHADIFFECIFNRFSLWVIENGGSDFANFVGLDLSDETVEKMREIHDNGDTPNYDIYGYHVGASILLPPGTSVETLFDNTPSEANPLFVGDSVFYRDKTDTASYMRAQDLDFFDPTEIIPVNTAHYFWVYVLKLDELFLRVTAAGMDDDPVKVDGFSVGSMCNFDFECETGARCDRHNFCSFP